MLKIKTFFILPVFASVMMLNFIFPAFLSAAASREGTGRSGHAAAAELRFGLATEPVTLDPLNPANTADGRSILFNVFEGLVKPDSSGALIPAVAQSYRIERDAMTYIFTIREGIQFHNGQQIRPEDAVFSLRRAASAGFTGLDRIATVEVSGPGEVRISLKEPDPEFLPYLTVGIVPENNPDRERNPIGSGPFSIESYTPQQSLRLVRNSRYWQSGIPSLQRVTIVFVANNDALITGLRGGNIEGARATGAMLAQLDLERFDVFHSFTNMVHMMALNNTQQPLNDLRVRQAINYAIDAQGIIDAAFYGQGEPSGSPLIPGLSHVYDESLRNPYPRNIAHARQLLAEAGYPNGFPLEITVPSNYTMHVDTAQVIVNQLGEAGIRASIHLVDWATWLSEVYRSRRYQATIISVDARNVSPRSFLERYLTGVDGNFFNFSSPDFDRVYNAALVEHSEERRIALYKEAQRIISENAAAVYIQDIIEFKVFPKGQFGGVVNYPLYVLDFAPMHRN